MVSWGTFAQCLGQEISVVRCRYLTKQKVYWKNARNLTVPSTRMYNCADIRTDKSGA